MPKNSHTARTSRATAPPRAPKMSRNRALDGLRGLAVIAVMAYHVTPDPFTGGWLGVDVFFVLSGYLIASMLLREQNRTGTLNYPRFLIRRARRLLPGLAMMLLAVLGAAAALESTDRRKTIAVDVLSSAAQIANWRLITADESYFAKVSAPSPIRHTWSLGVQEQFYLVFPLVLLLLFAHLRTYRALTITFTAAAAVSLACMVVLYEPGTDPSRVYFGTETRLFEILIGVIGAVTLDRRVRRAHRERRPAGIRGWSRATENRIGWAGLAALTALVAAMFTLDEFNPWLFSGGLAVVAAAAMLIITAATSPATNVLTRLLTNPFLTRAGDQSYSLYIWHWPVIVYLAPLMTDTSDLTRQLAAVAATIVISTISYTLVERPIHERGLSGLARPIPSLGPAVALTTALALPLGAAALAGTTGPTDNRNTTISLPADPNYGKTVAELSPGTPRRDVVLVGASTAVRLVESGRTERTPDINLTTSASFGCAPWLRDEVLDGGSPPESAECRTFRRDWPRTIKRANDPTVVFIPPSRILTDYRDPAGNTLSPGTAAYDRHITGILDELAKTARANGAAHVAIVNMPCHERVSYNSDDKTISRGNDFRTVQRLNTVIATWAKQSGVDVYDNYSLLCSGDTYHDSVNGVPLYDDGLHYSTESAPLIWQWLANEVRTHDTA